MNNKENHVNCKLRALKFQGETEEILDLINTCSDFIDCLYTFPENRVLIEFTSMALK